jgi:hypothetical protein
MAARALKLFNIFSVGHACCLRVCMPSQCPHAGEILVCFVKHVHDIKRLHRYGCLVSCGRGHPSRPSVRVTTAATMSGYGRRGRRGGRQGFIDNDRNQIESKRSRGGGSRGGRRGGCGQVRCCRHAGALNLGRQLIIHTYCLSLLPHPRQLLSLGLAGFMFLAGISRALFSRPAGFL